MKTAFSKLRRYYAAHGLRKTAQVFLRRLSGGTPDSVAVDGKGKIDIIRHYAGLLGHEHGEPIEGCRIDPMTMQWVIPNFGFGSGGHLNIFRFMNNLSKLGYRQRLVILPPFDWASPEAAAAAIGRWYLPLDAEIALGVEGFVPSHVTFATGWQTAYWVAKHRASRHKFYFVQDFEPSFYSISSDYMLAENTYRLGLRGITAGTWLKHHLEQNYGMRTEAVSFACDTDQYRPLPRRPGPNRNILFYSRHVTPRRLFELGLIALERVCVANPDVAVVFAGGDVSRFNVPFKHLNCGELTLAELPDLYSQCELTLVLSGTNLSLLPLEVAACGCPLVINDQPSTRWLLPEEAAFYAPCDPDGLAKTICSALDDEAGRASRAERAAEIALATSWSDEARRLSAHVENMTSKTEGSGVSTGDVSA